MVDDALAAAQGFTTAEARELRKACTLNLGSCYLNLKQYDLCVSECSDIISGARPPPGLPLRARPQGCCPAAGALIGALPAL